MRSHPIPRTVGEPVSVFRKMDVLKAHASYAKAKAGDADAAIELGA